MDKGRKHIQQFNANEVAFAHGFIRKNANRIHSARGHFYDRASARSISFGEAQSVASKGTVIEIHNLAGEYRALLRNRQGICVVVSLVTWELVTAYYNAPGDYHDTLNWNAYRWNQNIVEVIKSLRSAQ